MKASTQKLFILLALGVCLGASIKACAPIMLGGAVMGSLMAIDRRTEGTLVDDAGSELRAASRIRDNLGERGTAYLMGRVTQREANRATDIARSTSGVLKVVRVLEIISEEELQGMLPTKPTPVEVKK